MYKSVETLFYVPAAITDRRMSIMTMARSVHELALEGDVAGVEAAVEAKPEVVTSCDDSGRLPLHWAVSRGHIDLSSWLLDRSK